MQLMPIEIHPVIHYRSLLACMHNVELVAKANCSGVMLIQMDGNDEILDEAVGPIKANFPQLKVGVNRLGTGHLEGLLHNLELGCDATWVDNGHVTSEGPLSLAEVTRDILKKHPGHRFYAGVAFKYQMHEKDPPAAALNALGLGFIPTTSGSGTGSAPSLQKITAMAAVLPHHTLAVASGIDPENIAEYLPFLGHILVSTGISKSFSEFDERLLNLLVEKTKKV